MPLHAGRFRYRVVVQQKLAGSPQRKPTGEPDKSWVDFTTVWANIRPLRGQALFSAQQTSSKITTEIDVRYSSKTALITAAMRIKHGAVIYDIESVPPLRPALGNPLTIQCSTGANQG